jgi:hypothetical protein
MKTKNYCSAICLSESKRTGKMVNCHMCLTETYKARRELDSSKSGYYFCSRQCSLDYNYKERDGRSPNWKDGTFAYRSKALLHYGVICSNKQCEIRASGIVLNENMIDIHHIDRDRKNDDISNLMPLCKWCHVLYHRSGTNQDASNMLILR